MATKNQQKTKKKNYYNKEDQLNQNNTKPTSGVYALSTVLLK
jgi:hypothetical protein